ncbi:MAG: DUF302 domain-containing protein [Pyrinomonadaceae bacterium]
MATSAVFCKTYAPQDEAEFWRYPSHKLLSAFEDAENVGRSIDALRRSGIEENAIEVFCGEQGEKQIDFSGEKHGLWAKFVRSLQALSAEHLYLEYYQNELHSGGYLLQVAVGNSEQKNSVARLIHENGGKRVTYFGTWLIEEIANKTEHEEQSGYGFRRSVDLSFDEAVSRIKEALKEQGFGVLTEIDMKAKFKEKLGEEFPNYVILGACSPQHAFQALPMDMDLGLLLPCNVVVYEDRGKTIVAAVEATKMLSVAQNAELNEIAASVDEKLRQAVDAV